MKISALALLSVLGYASAGAPQLSISVRDGNFDGIDGLDPTLSWENEGKAGDMDLSYGIKSSVRPTSDIASLPRSIWGKASTNVSGWGVSARAEVEGTDFSRPTVQVDADNEDVDMSVRMVASNNDKDFNLRSVEATKGFDADGARVTVTPRFNLDNDERDVVINYSNDATNVKLTASADNQEVEVSHQMDATNVRLTASVDNQEVTISQQIDDNNRVAPTLNSNGDISVEWERRLSDDSSLTANLRPNDSLDVAWKDADWTATVNCPIDGANINGANVHIRRDVNF